MLLLFAYRIWAFPHWQMYSYSTTALFLLAGALVALVRFLETENRSMLLLAGLITGLAVICKQDYGAAGLVALNLVLIVRAISTPNGAKRIRPFGWYNGPAIAVAVATAAHFLRKGLFLEMARQTVWNHLFGIATFEHYTSLPRLFPLFEQSYQFRTIANAPYVPAITHSLDREAFTSSAFYSETILYDLALKIFYYAPYLIALAGAARLLWLRSALGDSARRSAYLRELALYALATLLLLALNKPVDYVHVAVLYWPFLCLLVVYSHALLGARRRRLAWIAVALAAVPAACALGYTARLAWLLRTEHTEPLRNDRAGIYVRPDEERVIDGVVEYVKAHSDPEEPIAVLPYYTLISFLAERQAPHRSAYVFWPIEYSPGREREIIEAIDSSGSQIAVYHFSQWISFPPMQEYASDLFRYLVDSFEIDEVFTSDVWGYAFAGLRRSPGPPEGRPLVTPEGARTRLSVEAPAEEPRLVTRNRRSQFFRTGLWPFRPVFVLRPLAESRRTVLAVPVDVPAASRLRTAVGVHPAYWYRKPESTVTFTIRAAESGQRRVIFSKTLDPHRHASDRGWLEVDLPLDEYGGRSIDLEFATECERASGEALQMGGWAIPRLVIRDPAGGS
jgi:hypothetical protein